MRHKFGLACLAFALVGCTEPRTPQEQAARQECLAKVELEQALEAESRCIQPGLGWDECPHRDEIMATLAEEQEKCR